MQKYSLTEEHRAQLKPWAERWIKIALRTEPQKEEEQARCVEAVNGLYDAANLERPRNIVFCASPVSAAIAAGIAAGVWYVREHPEFVGVVPESVLRAASRSAVAHFYGGPKVTLRLDAATRAATHAATEAATHAATEAATDAAAHAATDAAREHDRLAAFLIGCAKCYWSMRNGGNQWSGWVSYISAGRHIFKLPIDYSKWAHYETLAELSGPRFVHSKFTIVSDFPTTIGRDEQNRAHCADGPQIAWRDGTEAYSWHGTRVPKRLIMEPESYTRDETLALDNSEISRALAERLGWDRFLEKIGARSVNADGILGTGEDGQACTLRYELLETERFADDQPRFLRMESPQLNDGTQPWYIEPVHPGLTSARAARVWRTRRADGTWPEVAACETEQPDWLVRQGDLVFHEAMGRTAEVGLPRISGNALVSGTATGHSHRLVGNADVFDLGDGRKLIHRLGEKLEVVHDEHCTVELPEWSIQSVARQYDRENGWSDVQD